MNRALSSYAVFDLDGTLADSLGDIARALGRVMRHHGRSPISAEQTRELIGKGPKTLIERAWMASGRPADEKQAVEITKQYLEEYRKNPKGGTRSFPGVDEGLRRLVQRGWKLGLCTNKDGRTAVLKREEVDRSTPRIMAQYGITEVSRTEVGERRLAKGSFEKREEK